jgi:hypothetical protein
MYEVEYLVHEGSDQGWSVMIIQRAKKKRRTETRTSIWMMISTSGVVLDKGAQLDKWYVELLPSLMLQPRSGEGDDGDEKILILHLCIPLLHTVPECVRALGEGRHVRALRVYKTLAPSSSKVERSDYTICELPPRVGR